MSLFDSFKKAFHSQTTTPPGQALSPASGAAKSGAGTSQPLPGPADEKPTPGAVARQLLFVGGDPSWYKLIEQDMQRHEPSWRCQYTKDSAGARMTLASAVAFNVLIVDGRHRYPSRKIACVFEGHWLRWELHQ